MSNENKTQEKLKEDEEIYDEIKGLDPSFFALK